MRDHRTLRRLRGENVNARERNPPPPPRSFLFHAGE
jgi:hypothetical protein